MHVILEAAVKQYFLMVPPENFAITNNGNMCGKRKLWWWKFGAIMYSSAFMEKLTVVPCNTMSIELVSHARDVQS